MPSTTQSKAIDPNRLPLNAKPTHYDITLKTDLIGLKFSGRVKVDLDIIEETSAITFNISNLELYDISLQGPTPDIKQVPSALILDANAERATTQFGQPLEKGTTVQLQINYKAPLARSMSGYYHSSWEREGKTEYYSLTQFEPIAARRAFPCWDEPLLKATYKTAMISRADTVNLSNMPVELEEVYSTDNANESPGEWKITHFETTPLVSSYLIAFANGQFDFLENSYKSPLSGKTRPLRIYATPDNIHQAQYALDLKAKIMPMYEEIFDVEFPLPKLDTLVVDDIEGAMENWGLIIGRKAAFLLDPQEGGVAARTLVASILCHEVAHMWFGNITTMAWWDTLYLNEGFATLISEYVVMNKIYPEWRMHSGFIAGYLHDALSLDAKPSSHPIEVAVPDAKQVHQIFDALSYAKAASVLRMLLALIGEEKFLRGVSIYLKKHLYGNTVTKNLWDGMSEATGLDIASTMENWITQTGFPVLTVTETSDGIRVRQDRFLERGAPADADNQTLWHVPLRLVRAGADGAADVDTALVLRERETALALDTRRPFKLNADTAGVYRVLYAPARLAQIAAAAAADERVFSVDDRIGLVHDAFALAGAGLARVSGALDVVATLRGEKEFLVWKGIRDRMRHLVQVWWEDEEISDLLAAFCRGLYSPIVEKLGFDYDEAESADTKRLRTLAISAAAAAGDKNVVDELTRRFNEYRKTNDDRLIPSDLEETTYATVVKYGGREQYDVMRALYAKPKNPGTQSAAIAGLCAPTDPALVEETLGFVLAGARGQDIFVFFAALSANAAARRRLAAFTTQNFDALLERLSSGFAVSYVVRSAFELLTTDEDATETEAFFAGRDCSKFNLPLNQSLDTIRASSALIKRSTDDVLVWLRNERGQRGE